MKRFAATVVAITIISLPVLANSQSDPTNGSVLPYPQSPFNGVINTTAKNSKPDFPKAIQPPKGAPNILLILTDDVGFGASSTFGGPIQTPTFQQEANDGLRYTTYHTTALMFTDTRGANNGPQSPYLRKWRDHRDGNGVSWLQFTHAAELRNHSADLTRKRL